MKKIYILSLITILSFFSYHSVKAGYRPPFGGEYTNVCGSGYNANFYSCPANCNIQGGWCETRSGEWIYIFVCDGRLDECRTGLRGPFQGRYYVTSYASIGSNKTVQIDVFDKKCTEGGWTCGDSNLKGYLVWYSGSGGSVGGGSQIQCDTNDVVLQVIPNPSQVGNLITFRVIGGDTQNWWENQFSGGVTNCQETIYGRETRCTAQTPGTYTWTRKWKRCVGDIYNCSNWCYKSVQFTINPQPISIPLTVNCSVSPSPVVRTNQAVTFSASASGGQSPYTYIWTGSCNSNSSSCTTSFSSPGTYSATVTVTDFSNPPRSMSTTCSVRVIDRPRVTTLPPVETY